MKLKSEHTDQIVELSQIMRDLGKAAGSPSAQDILDAALARGLYEYQREIFRIINQHKNPLLN